MRIEERVPTFTGAPVDLDTPALVIDAQKMEENILGMADVAESRGYPGTVLGRVTEEHGMLSIDEDSDLQVGDTLEIIPNHVCSTVNLHDEIYVLAAAGSSEKVCVAARGMVR